MENLERPDLHKIDLMIVSSVSQKTKRGDDYRRLNLRSADGKISFSSVMWSNDLRKFSDEKIFRAGNTIRLVSFDLPSNYTDYVIHDLILIKEGRIGLTEEEREEKFGQIEKYVTEIANDKLRDFVKMKLRTYAEAFKIAPAARVMHHNYLGGLLQHTCECLELAENFVNHYPKVDRGTIYAACILHDFGKIWEYAIDINSGAITYNTDFTTRWISHSQWGFCTCMSAGFETVAKMIAAHHSRLDWGAVIDLDTEGLEPICYLLHHIDDLSAKFGKTTVMDL